MVVPEENLCNVIRQHGQEKIMTELMLAYDQEMKQHQELVTKLAEQLCNRDNECSEYEKKHKKLQDDIQSVQKRLKLMHKENKCLKKRLKKSLKFVSYLDNQLTLIKSSAIFFKGHNL
ncbi:hypothetical protein [Phthorimaea operculella granulovirus]|uniref:Uncharacterized protein n=1 Tax=Phthorimaea operculella granulovirus TaxID=192584 RepID=Q8JS19_9BBAC|nr:hypothetical protein [Phthorimaea operculella granulovirus]AAM70238.1 hypothetical protein [Phthorimaea operculella granulovirus]ANY57429.1 hypothetical protein PhopGVgp040 [Phthorimaea operculella granulovirus]QBH65875.1 hypothetical protein PhopGVgp040 [Phthorimaea operculella granulovirus]QBH66005.1 hypothetical protein PhopGVgp040 [Phthorimaea operculella granulovirus]QBH66135.1 hypothetical protein PhopGVgp040 [Phthorimaea operculella granulovirus]